MRRKLLEAGVTDFERNVELNIVLVKKIKSLKEKGHSYQAIAGKFNLWKVRTRSGKGKWFGKTVRELSVESI